MLLQLQIEMFMDLRSFMPDALLSSNWLSFFANYLLGIVLLYGVWHFWQSDV